jgi:uncharacterized membrane protein
MDMSIWFSWIHVVATLVWLGGLAFLILVLYPMMTRGMINPSLFYEIGMRFRPFVWVSMATLILTGMIKMQMVGGYTHLPKVIQDKIWIGLLMMALSLLTTLYFLPHLIEAEGAEESQNKVVLNKGYLSFSVVILIMGLAIFLLLATAGLF